MEILRAYDLTQTVWSAAQLAGCGPKTVKRYVEARDAGRSPYQRESRPRAIDPFLDKIEQWVDDSHCKIRGVPTFALSDNAKTVTVEHVAVIPVRHPQMVELGRHYGCSVGSCVPFDPQSKGGVETTVKLTKWDLVPTAANLLPGTDVGTRLGSGRDANRSTRPPRRARRPRG